MEIGHRIKQAREKVPLTQTGLAKAVGVTRGLVGAWESHRKKPGRDNLLAVARATSVSVAYLLGQEGFDDIQLHTESSDEVALLRHYRQLSGRQKQNVAQLLNLSVQIRQEIEEEREPAKVE